MKHILLFLFLITWSFSVVAEEPEENIFPSSDAMPISADKGDGALNSGVTSTLEGTVAEDKYAGQYQRATVQNLSKLYWMKNKFDFADDDAIDKFVFINECEFYKKNYRDDFKWAKVRRAARSMIKEYLPTYSDKFKIIVPIDLGRYDIEKGGFPLIGNTAFEDLRRVQIGGNYHYVCDDGSEIDGYPRNISLILHAPFNYNFFNLDEHLAQGYILRNNDTRAELPPGFSNNKSYNRLAFARFRLHVIDYQEDVKEGADLLSALMFGKIEGIDIFENANETGLLSSTSFK
jgi:hypothetical protein